MKEIILYRSFWKSLLLTLGTAIFVAMGFFILLQGKSADKWIAWGCIIFFGFCLVISLYQLLNKKAQITINEQGIKHKVLKHDILLWEDIKGAHILSVQRTKILALEVEKKIEPSYGKSKFAKGLAKMGKSFGFQEINIPLVNLGVNSKVLMCLVNELATTENSQRADKIRTFEQQYL